MDKLLAVLPASGAMEFVDFMAAAREAGARGDLWLRLKHSGQLYSWIDATSGKHMVSRNPQPGG